MPFWAKVRLLAPTALAARLLLLALGAFTSWTTGHAPDQPLLLLALLYLVGTALLFVFATPERPLWLACLAAALDVTVVTTFVGLIGNGADTWALYVFPVTAAGASGRIPATVAGGLSLAGYGVLAGIAGIQAGLWPIGFLLAIGVLIALLPSRRLADWQQRQAREQVAAAREAERRERVLLQAAMRLVATLEPELVAPIVTQAASDGLAAEAELTPEGGTSDEPAVPGGVVLSVDERHRLRVKAHDGGLKREDLAWLKRLADLAGAALARCHQHVDLQTEERRLRTVWESLPAPAVLWSAAGDLLLANHLYRELQPGLDMDERRGESEVTVGDPPRVFSVLRVPLPGSDCELALLREITRERRELTAKDEFLSLVGHELRTPLTSIHGFSQMIDRNLSVIKQQVGQLDRLINDLANESAGASGELSLDLQLANVADLATDAAERFKASHPDRTLELDVRQVPLVKADPARLTQVVDNLLSNAAKYSPEDRPIRMRVEADEAQVVLRVQDEGAGIEHEHLPRVFDRFYRAPNAKTERVKGLGLGLSIVQDLVLAHGGRVWAESAGPERGSTFLVSLPAAANGREGASKSTA